jgi:polysaccharide export outer membrane protein
MDNAKFSGALASAEKNYIVNKFDYLGISIFTNKGEMLLDPNGELKYTAEQIARQQQNMSLAMSGGGALMGGGAFNGNNNMLQGSVQGSTTQFAFPRYMVNEKGSIFMPIVGELKVEGLAIYQVDSLISKTYSQHYKEVYAITRLLNRRIVVLGALGNRILPLDNENVSLIEAVSMAGNLGITARGDNIRLIRNVMTKPEIQVINLTTWEGVKAANLRVEPGDIIYIEPRRRVYRQETLQDVSGVIGTVGTILSTIISVVTLSIALSR